MHFWEVFSPDTVETRPVASGTVRIGSQVTSPERRIPEAVFQTADGRTFAMKSEVAGEIDFYGRKIQRRRDNSFGGNTAELLAHRVLLLYRIPSVDRIPLLVDRDKPAVLAPDLVCEYLRPVEMERPLFVSQFVERINTLRAKRPVQVITYGEEGTFPDGMNEDATVAPYERRVVGMDESALVRIASLLDE